MENKRFVNAPEVMYKGYCVENRQWAHGYLMPRTTYTSKS